VKIAADRTKCIGAGQCVMVAPDLFLQDAEEGLVVVRIDHLDDTAMAAAELAVRSCPTRALGLLDEPARSAGSLE
jgi:ferredoxin